MARVRVDVRLVIGANPYSNEFTCSRTDCRKVFSKGGIYLRLLPQPELTGSPDTIVALCPDCSKKLSEGLIDLNDTTTVVNLREK